MPVNFGSQREKIAKVELGGTQKPTDLFAKLAQTLLSA